METTYYQFHVTQLSVPVSGHREGTTGRRVYCTLAPKEPQGVWKPRENKVLNLDDYRPQPEETVSSAAPTPRQESPAVSRLTLFLDICATAAVVLFTALAAMCF